MNNAINNKLYRRTDATVNAMRRLTAERGGISGCNIDAVHLQLVHAGMALHGVAGVEQTAARVADVRAGARVNRQQVLAMHGARLERRATDGAHERTTRAVHRRLVLAQMTLQTHTRSRDRSVTCRITQHGVDPQITTRRWPQPGRRQLPAARAQAAAHWLSGHRWRVTACT